MKKIPVIISILIVFSGCVIHKAEFSGVPFEKNPSLENTRFTQEWSDSLTHFLKNNLATTGMLILQNGKILYEYGNIKEVSYIASCRKSVLSILYGKYVKNGTIDLQQTIGDIGIDEKDGLLPQEKEATVNDIITARSGVFHIAANEGYDKKNILKRGSVKHGEYFVYNNWDFNVAGYIFEKKTGHSIYEEIEEQLAKPLGFQDWNIKNQHKKYGKRKSQYPAYHIYLSTRDMAKIGQLMLNNGNRNGNQIVSKDWIKKITTTVTPVDTVNKRYGRDRLSPFQFSYGYMWWIVDNIKHDPVFEGAYSATGYGGQFITVIPKLNMVVAHKTKLGLLNYLGLKYDVGDRQYWNLLYRYIGATKE